MRLSATTRDVLRYCRERRNMEKDGWEYLPRPTYCGDPRRDHRIVDSCIGHEGEGVWLKVMPPSNVVTPDAPYSFWLGAHG